MSKDFLIALSLANLCFLQVWRGLLDPASELYYYHWKRFPGWAALTAITLNLLILSTLLTTSRMVARRDGREAVASAARWAFLLVLLFALNSIRLQFDFLLQPRLIGLVGRTGLIVLSALLLALALFLFRRYGLRRTTRAGATFLLVLSPLVVINFTQATWLALKYSNQLRDKPAAPALPGKSEDAVRVLWLVFDELDQRVAFAERPDGLALPSLDRLRSESLFAVNAYPPSGDTLTSLPALVSGRLVSDATRSGPDELRVTFPDDGTTAGWSEQPSVFSHARSLGHNTALVGWYHPYCRLLAGQLTFCAWETGSAITRPGKSSVARNMLAQVRVLLLSAPMWQRFNLGRAVERRVFDEGSLAELKRQKVDVQRAIRERAVELVNRTDLGLIMVHWPTPHPPGIYDRSTRSFSISKEKSYLDNLVLVDDTLGELRQRMESAGTWEGTAVLVTSDHWLRTGLRKTQPALLAPEDLAILSDNDERRVPFILKLPWQKNGTVHEPAFNTVITRDLLLAILRRELNDARELSDWLNLRRTQDQNNSGDRR